MILTEINQVPKKNNVVIIGSGPAGLTIALQLEKKNIPCLIIEAGRSIPDDNSQTHYSGKVIGDNYVDLEIARLRQFGGTTGHWGGNCMDLDSFDFKNWPINKKDLDPYSSEANNILNIKGEFKKKKFNNNLDIINYKYSDVRFKEKYFKYIKKSKYISIILNTTLINLEGHDQNITGINIFNKSNKKILGKTFILACGGIENSRLLLWSKEKNSNLFNPKMPIGNYWMDHPYHDMAEGLLFKDQFDNYIKKNTLEKDFDLSCKYAFYFATNSKFVNNSNLLNSSIILGVSKEKNNISKNKFLNQLNCVAPNFLSDKFLNKNKAEFYKINMSLMTDQDSEFQNKITLDKVKDFFNIPKPIIYWQRSQKVRESSRIIAENFGNFLVQNDLGRIAVEEYLYDKTDYDHKNGYHHMGGTRMGTSADNSVVDINLKVHNINNLYISGSSVFCSAGYAHPTLTVVKLALRLSNHISSIL